MSLTKGEAHAQHPSHPPVLPKASPPKLRLAHGVITPAQFSSNLNGIILQIRYNSLVQLHNFITLPARLIPKDLYTSHILRHEKVNGSS